MLILKTIKKMNSVGAHSAREWGKAWRKSYFELGGTSLKSASKGCPKAAAFGLWKLGLIQSAGLPLRSMSITEFIKPLEKMRRIQQLPR